jgi:hypothetical protein
MSWVGDGMPRSFTHTGLTTRIQKLIACSAVVAAMGIGLYAAASHRGLQAEAEILEVFSKNQVTYVAGQFQDRRGLVHQIEIRYMPRKSYSLPMPSPGAGFSVMYSDDEPQKAKLIQAYRDDRFGMLVAFFSCLVLALAAWTGRLRSPFGK